MRIRTEYRGLLVLLLNFAYLGVNTTMLLSITAFDCFLLIVYCCIVVTVAFIVFLELNSCGGWAGQFLIGVSLSMNTSSIFRMQYLEAAKQS